MSKVLIGALLGAVLGLIDGASAWFYPDVRTQIMSIVIGSTMKGLVAGLITGWFAKRYRSLPIGIAVGGSVGLLLAFLAAHASVDPQGHHHYVEIMLPGTVVGLIIGFATQRYGAGATAAAKA